MKRTMIFAAAAAMFMFASCQKEEGTPVQNSRSDELVFTATIDRSATKTSINTDASSADKGKVSWEVNDEISVSDGTNTALYYIADADDIAGDGSAAFTYKSGTRPSGDAASYTATYGDAITAVQTYSSTAGKLPMSGTSDGDNKTKLNFTVTCGLLKLNLTALGTESDKTVSKVEITGTPTDGTRTTYTLSCSPEGVSISSAADFYIALPAGSYDDMAFYNKGGYVCRKTSSSGMTIEANKIQPVNLTGIAFNLLSGKFSVSATKQVRFAKGNLYYSTDDSKYHLESAQNVTSATLDQTAYTASHICHFFWSNTTDWNTSGKEPWASKYSYSAQNTDDKFFCSTDNPMTVDGQSGLQALTGGNDGEWHYLFNSRTNASNLYKTGVSVTIGDKTVANCVVIAPDGYTGTIASSYDAEAWSAAESSGLVCLPAAKYRDGTSLRTSSGNTFYWTAMSDDSKASYAYSLQFNAGNILNYSGNRMYGYSVRLVCPVSD